MFKNNVRKYWRKRNVLSSRRAVFKGGRLRVQPSPPPPKKNVEKQISHWKICFKIFGRWNMAKSFWNAKKSHLEAIKCKKTFGGRCSVPDPARGAYSAPPVPLAGWERAGYKNQERTKNSRTKTQVSKNPIPDLGLLGLGLRPCPRSLTFRPLTS